jgi:hypothetical protein
LHKPSKRTRIAQLMERLIQANEDAGILLTPSNALKELPLT